MSCPGWDLETIIAQASALGFDGFELRGLRGELHLPFAPELARAPELVRQRLAAAKVELVCLGTSVSLDSKRAATISEQKGRLVENLELAARVGCPFVRIFVGEVQRWDNRRAALGRIAEQLIDVTPLAARHGVTLLVENGGDFPGSDDLWFLLDAVAHPSVKACWNQVYALTGRERPTTSIPRLGTKLGLVHLCDASFSEEGTLTDYRPLGEGDAEVRRQIELLRGIAYSGYVLFEWPKLWVESLPGPEAVLGPAAKLMRECIDARQAVLSAYKGDKQAPKFAKAG